MKHPNVSFPSAGYTVYFLPKLQRLPHSITRVSHLMDQVRHRRSRNPSLLQKLLVRRADGKAKQAELWAEDESVFHQRLEYLELSADTTRSTIALAFSADGYDVGLW